MTASGGEKLLFGPVTGLLGGVGKFLEKDLRTQELWFDPYSKSVGMQEALFLKVLGPQFFWKAIHRLGRAFGYSLNRVPHALGGRDYHLTQIRAQARAVEILEEYLQTRSEVSEIEKSFFELGIDAVGLKSIAVKLMGLRFWHLVENVMTLKNQGVIIKEVYLPEGEFPLELLDVFEQWMSVRVFPVPTKKSALLKAFAWSKQRALRSYWKKRLEIKNTGQLENQENLVLCEFVDPKCRTEGATHPNFVKEESGLKIMAYVRRGTSDKFGKEAFGEAPFEVLFLDELGISSDLYVQGLKVLDSVSKSMAKSYCSFQHVRKMLEFTELFVDFSALLGASKPAVHLMAPYPNGRSLGRFFESGLLTGVCRKFEVKSAGYQSRVLYHHTWEYYFEVFDLYAYWSPAWDKAHSHTQFFTDKAFIGEVFLDSLLSGKESRVEKTEKASGPLNVVLFTGDLNDLNGDDYPMHYTMDYALGFLRACVEAVVIAREEESDVAIRLFLKTKDESQSVALLSDPGLKDYQEKHSVKIEVMDLARHDLASPLLFADKVLSSGFTTPGVDALLLGKPSRYFTPYSHEYNALFDERSSLALRSPQQIADFLVNDELGDEEGLRTELDPFRDGRSSMRLAESLKLLIHNDSDVKQKINNEREAFNGEA